ncbi:hypothetical protein [Lyngbya confervoides]|uniref:Uncharacterized protein n=1 Tax=Lyngbya confervoides BDU141951 TaxID=1574623 RepID=A0ABD4T7D5_9CYAN|nr:hypothetical protein [Lyngbya confervoides]MCM1984449.1 hypothetical protein [Lyngbya confervoides BDU141951]
MSQDNDSSVKVSLISENREKEAESVQAQTDFSIAIDGKLDISDYVLDVPLSKKSIQDVACWTERHREVTRTTLVMWLLRFFGCSLIGIFFLTGIFAFNPKADKKLIRDLIPPIITTQVTLLGVAFGFYFSRDQNNQR